MVGRGEGDRGGVDGVVGDRGSMDQRGCEYNCKKGGDVVDISFTVGLGAGDVVGNCVCLTKEIVKER